MLINAVLRMHTCAGSSESLSHAVSTKISWNYMCGSREGDRGSGPPPPTHPLKNHKNTGFSSNTGPDSLKNRSCEASILCWAFIGMPAKHRFAGGPMMARLKWDLDPPSPHQLKKKRCQSWIPSDKTFWIRA